MTGEIDVVTADDQETVSHDLEMCLVETGMVVGIGEIGRRRGDNRDLCCRLFSRWADEEGYVALERFGAGAGSYLQCIETRTPIGRNDQFARRLPVRVFEIVFMEMNRAILPGASVQLCV